jgi:hypothetical protein
MSSVSGVSVKRMYGLFFSLFFLLGGEINGILNISRSFLTRWEKNRGENAKKILVFSAKKRENSTKPCDFFKRTRRLTLHLSEGQP